MQNISLSGLDIEGLKVRAKSYRNSLGIGLCNAQDKVACELGFQNWSVLVKNHPKLVSKGKLSTMKSSIRSAISLATANVVWRHGELFISNPINGKPIPHTPSGMPLLGVSFKTRYEAEKFIYAHWPNGIVMAQVQ